MIKDTIDSGVQNKKAKIILRAQYNRKRFLTDFYF